MKEILEKLYEFDFQALTGDALEGNIIEILKEIGYTELDPAE